jgi:two-component system nitrogen regulation sensor histidine kinase NtrY
VAGALSRPATLRARLLGALAMVAVIPTVGLSLALTRVIARSYAETTDRRLSLATAAVRARLDQMRALAEARVAAVALHDLPSTGAANGGALVHSGSMVADLPVLEILGGAGNVISSRHWPAGEGLPAAEATFPPDGAIRVLKVAEGYGARDVLTVTATQPSQWHGAAVDVRGGFLLDEAFLASLSTPLGMVVGLRDEVRDVWWVEPRSPLASWSAPRLTPGHGELSLAGVRYRWSAETLRPGLRAVVAVSATEAAATAAQVTRLAVVATAAALLVAVAAALWLSGWIATPVRRLAGALGDLGSGSEDTPVPETGAAELRELARSFNRMRAELQESRGRLLQAERVAAWREMARRLAHELKNPLFPIQVSIETLGRVFERERPAVGGDGFATLFRESCDTILEELRLLRGIIDEFSGFARLPRPRLEATDVNAVVGQVIALHGARAGAVAIHPELDPTLPVVPADRDLLVHALGNLVANALDAMPDGGALRVRTACVEGGVTVSVADTGPGIAEEQRARLFTPYFTTKKGGTGLGLSIAQSIVSDHGGRIDVHTAPGEGTTFRLFLPSKMPAPTSSRRSSPPVAKREGDA